MNIIDYIREEVRRQGHDVTASDGLMRVSWMLEAWCEALPNAAFAPTMGDIVRLGMLIEPGKNCDGIRRCHVRVGMNSTPPPDEVVPRLTRLLSVYDAMSPLEFYKEFELIHPFEDGNGRTGKILLNWKNGTLLDPIFPPADLFGAPILNP